MQFWSAERKIRFARCVSAASTAQTKICVQQTKIAFMAASSVQPLTSVRAKGTVSVHAQDPHFICGVLRTFLVLNFYWKIAPQSVSNKMLETDWGADRKLD